MIKQLCLPLNRIQVTHSLEKIKPVNDSEFTGFYQLLSLVFTSLHNYGRRFFCGSSE